MAKKRKYIQQFIKGTVFRLVKGQRVEVPTVDEAIETYYTCCGPDCCENIYRYIDKATGTTYVQYAYNGSLVFETEAAYQAKKANGDFSY